MRKQDIIEYFITLKEDIIFEIEDILYTELNNSLTFKQLQQVDHKRQELNTIYKIIEFLEKGDF